MSEVYRDRILSNAALRAAWRSSRYAYFFAREVEGVPVVEAGRPGESNDDGRAGVLVGVRGVMTDTLGDIGCSARGLEISDAVKEHLPECLPAGL